MKAPGNYFINSGTLPLRDYISLRKIIGTIDTDGKSNHYLRIKMITQQSNANSFFVFDYIELVPVSVYDNDEYLEDKY